MIRLLLVLLIWLFASGPEPAPAPAATAKRDLRIRLVDGKGALLTEEEYASVWWAEDPEAEFGNGAGPFEKGELVLKEIPATPVVLVALPSGFVVPSERWPRKIVPAGVTETDLVLDMGAERTLKILAWKTGTLGIGRLAAVTDLEPSHHGIDEEGRLSIEGLRPGVHYNLYVREDGSDRYALLRDLPADEPWPDIELANGGEITGRVILPKGCDGACVALMVDKAVMVDANLEDDGSFRIRGVPWGKWTVVAYTTFKDVYLAKTVEAKSGEPILLDLTK